MRKYVIFRFSETKERIDFINLQVGEIGGFQEIGRFQNLLVLDFGRSSKPMVFKILVAPP